MTTRLATLPAWKNEADFLFVQASFDLEALLRWRESITFEGKVFAGVLVIASAGMAKTLVETTGQIELPGELLDELSENPAAGVERCCALMADIRASGAFDGVHLIPVGRYRSVAARLEQDGWRRHT